MTEATYIGAYWGPRRESVDECADRLSQMLGALSELSPLFSTWYRRGWSRASALRRPVTASIEELQALIRSGQSRSEMDRKVVVEELGYRVGLWNGQDAEVGLTVRCGASVDVPGMSSNALVLHLPSGYSASERIYELDRAAEVFHAVVSAWAPAWATWVSNSLRESQGPTAGGRVAGWFTYLGEEYRVNPRRLPVGFARRSVGGGTLITPGCELNSLTPEPLRFIRTAISGGASRRPWIRLNGGKVRRARRP